jgi:hypothetical protein
MVLKEYDDVEDEDIRKELFWVKIMQPFQPFMFAKEKRLHSNPICWTNNPKNLSRKLKMSVKSIEDT